MLKAVLVVLLAGFCAPSAALAQPPDAATDEEETAEEETADEGRMRVLWASLWLTAAGLSIVNEVSGSDSEMLDGAVEGAYAVAAVVTLVDLTRAGRQHSVGVSASPKGGRFVNYRVGW